MRWGQSLPLALALLASRVVAASDVLIPRGPAPIPIDSAGGGAGIGGKLARLAQPEKVGRSCGEG